MSYRFKNISFTGRCRKAFTLVEAIAATAIIGIIASSIMIVFIRCSSAVRDSIRRMQAFEVARENMETMLGKETISEQVVYGYSDKYPSIQWTNRVETFYEPVNEKMWLRAVCSAQYEDSEDQTRSVEFTHWLTKLNKKQTQQILEARKMLKNLADELGLDGPDELQPELPDNTASPGTQRNPTIKTPIDFIKQIEQN